MRLTIALLTLLSSASLCAWHNGGDRIEQPPKFGTHDYIAYKALDRVPAEKIAWIKLHLTAYFIGTEAPDTNKKIPGVTEGGYHDSLMCHCILFDAQEHATETHARDRTRQEFDRASAALAAGQMERAAFFAGAMAHYVGDLSQFCHVMGVGSHWGAEDQKLHAAYENAVDATVNYMTRSSTLLDGYLAPATVEAMTPENIAEEVALLTEEGGGTPQNPGWMIQQLTALGRAGKIGKIDQWSQAFKDRTGENVNVSVNAVARLLGLLMQS